MVRGGVRSPAAALQHGQMPGRGQTGVQLAGKKRMGKHILRIKQDEAKRVAASMRQRLLNQH